MKTTLFYFSATGSSLNVARKIASGLGETELVSIPKVMHHPEVKLKLNDVFLR